MRWNLRRRSWRPFLTKKRLCPPVCGSASHEIMRTTTPTKLVSIRTLEPPALVKWLVQTLWAIIVLVRDFYYTPISTTRYSRPLTPSQTPIRIRIIKSIEVRTLRRIDSWKVVAMFMLTSAVVGTSAVSDVGSNAHGEGLNLLFGCFACVWMDWWSVVRGSLSSTYVFVSDCMDSLFACAQAFVTAWI